MIVKFFKRAEKANTKNGESVRNYLLNKERLENGTARLLNGDPDLTTAIINSNNFASNYTSGVLSFDEQESKRIKEIHKQQIMKSFEECLLPNFDEDRYMSYWVEHNDKGRLELNFVIAKVDLKTSKFLNVYNHATDMKRVDNWKNIINFEYSLTDPNDPVRKRNIAPTFNDKRMKNKDLKQKINDFVSYHIEHGNIKNHDDVVNALTKAGLKIDNIKNKSISVKNPNENAKNIRLTGAFFEKNFVASERTQQHIQAKQKQYNQQAEQRYLQQRQEYDSRTQKRQNFLFERYQTDPPPQPKNNENQTFKPMCNKKFKLNELDLFDNDDEPVFASYRIDERANKRVLIYDYQYDPEADDADATSYDRQEIEHLAGTLINRVKERIVETTTNATDADADRKRHSVIADFAKLACTTKPVVVNDSEYQRERNKSIENMRTKTNIEFEIATATTDAITANTRAITANTTDATNNTKAITERERERLEQQQQRQQQELERQRQAQQQAPRPKFRP